jgi:hypothetical protein
MITSAVSYFINAAWTKSQDAEKDKMDYEPRSPGWCVDHLDRRWLHVRRIDEADPRPGRRGLRPWKLATVITWWHPRRRHHPRAGKVFTSVNSHAGGDRRSRRHAQHFSGLVAGNFSAYWLG